MQHRLDRPLQESRNAGIVGVDTRRVACEGTFEQQHVSLPGWRPEHAPVTGAVEERLPAVGGEAKERILPGQYRVVRIDE
ncbi:hypothetical protein [Anatilimnocola aggregata]|uniref:hypothetical protein n=1 Tax=Anatilimnocola aggregata TaxID=2528021 RepID=UPI0011A61418|nr:hypothetical protein [Anatilimnocola aggregata]